MTMTTNQLDSRQELRSRPVTAADPRTTPQSGLRFTIITSLICSTLLALTMSRDSLWTDEAFSAYIASLKNVGSILSTLARGDSSDLLTSAYYVYLHGWSVVFSTSELSLRAANLPFVLLSSLGMCWASQRIFRSRILWILAALLPFSWTYAPDARAHFALVGWSTACFVCLLAALESPSPSERRWLPAVVLCSLVVGLLFNVLMVLSIAPLLFIVLLYLWRRPGAVVCAMWRKALQLAAAPLLAVLTYIGWGLSHGVPAEYPKPELMSVASVLYRFVGLTGYGPNRRFDIAFGPYIPAMVLAAVLLGAAVGGMGFAGFRSRSSTRFLALWGALIIGLLQVLLLSVVFRQQEDVRHLAALAPLLVLAIMAGFGEPAGQGRALVAAVSLGLICAVWLYSDLILRFSPEYRSQGEDFRLAVAQTIALERDLHADVALVADPAAAAYYGLDLDGPKPCFPLVENCREAFAKVPWPKKAPAEYAISWTSKNIGDWLESHGGSHRPAIVLISETRHPMYKDSPWWSFLKSGAPAERYTPRGFLIQVFK